MANYKTTSSRSIRKREEHSRKKPTMRPVIFDRKNLVKECVIIKNMRT